MSKFNPSIAIVSLAALMTFTSVASAGAMPLPDLAVPRRSDIIQVHDHHGHHHHHIRQGYDDYYNNYDDSGVLFKSFVTGTLFSHDDRQAYYSDSHTRACAARYRSYSAYDNSYQPSRGPRQQCR
jgi:hypothetical protein